MKPLNLLIYLFLFSGLPACDSDSDVSSMRGEEYEIVVVMNNIAWDGASGSLIRAQLTSPLRFLPQIEPSMDVMYVIPEQFNDSTRHARNILIVNIDKTQFSTVSFKKKTDKWLKDQVIMYLNAPDEQSLEAFLNDNHAILPEQFTREEMARKKSFLSKTHSETVLNMVKKKFDITLYAPTDITSFKETDNCTWFSNNASVGRTDFLIYSFPYENRESLSLENLISKRNSIVETMIPGFQQGTYMTTEKTGINYSTTTLHGKYCVIMQGLWRLQGNESLVGPFVSYARMDDAKNRIIVVEGFVYEPVKENRNYIRNLEAAIQTVRFPDEQEELQ